ncbi:autotransporter domain-containing protein [Kaistia granuli]|uniref:autotransporter family protein n=1 Tax=Kaistia granuli TaxID=363259 RepID=UPI00036CC77A|nr:autotransporter domain-containing protein [Kaistia granuli]
MSIRNLDDARSRSDRARLFAGVSLVAVAMISGQASAAPDPLTTVYNQAELDALVLAGEIERLANTALVLDNGRPVRFSDHMILDGVGWGSNPKAYFAKVGAGILTLDGATITGGEVHIGAGGIHFAGANKMDYVALGSGATGDAAMTIDSGSVTFGVALQVGDFGGTGSVRQTGGIVQIKEDCAEPTSCGSLNIGNQGGHGTYTIEGGELKLVGGIHSIGRNTSSWGAGSGTLNIQGGLVSLSEDTDSGFYNPGDLVLGDRDPGGLGGAEASGTIRQTGGTLRIGGGSHFYLGGYGESLYDLKGGTLEIGGTSLVEFYAVNAPNFSAGNSAFNLGGGTIKVIGSALSTDVDATLERDTVSTIDTNGLGATWSGALNGEGGLNKVGRGDLEIGWLSRDISGLRIAEGSVTLDSDMRFGEFYPPRGFGPLMRPANTETALDLAAGTRLNVNGDFSLGAEDRFVVGIDGTGDAGRIAVRDHADLGGATLEINAASGYKANHHYTIVTAGSFEQSNAADTFVIAPHDFAYVTPELLFDEPMLGRSLDRNLYLNLKRERDFASAARTPNQTAAANGLESVGSGALYEAVEVISTAAAPAALDAISGEIHAGAAGVLLNDSFFLRDAVLGRLSYPSQGSSAPSVSLASGYAEGDKRSAAPFPGDSAPEAEPNTFWSQAYGSWGHSDGDGNVAKLDRSTGGVLVGYDRSFGQDWLIGAAAGYSRSSFDLDDRASTGDSDNYHLLAYAGGSFAALNVRLGASYSWNEVDTTRNVALPGFFEQVKADYSAGTTQLFGELSHDFAVGPATTLSPFAGLAYVHLSTDGYNETGGSAALGVDSSNQSVTYGTLGVRADHKIAVGGVGVTLQGAAAWQHAWGDVTPVSTLAFAGGDAFQVTGAPIAEDALLLKAGFDVDVAAGAKFGLFYAGQIASDAADNSVQGRFSVSF